MATLIFYLRGSPTVANTPLKSTALCSTNPPQTLTFFLSTSPTFQSHSTYKGGEKPSINVKSNSQKESILLHELQIILDIQNYMAKNTFTFLQLTLPIIIVSKCINSISCRKKTTNCEIGLGASSSYTKVLTHNQLHLQKNL